MRSRGRHHISGEEGAWEAPHGFFAYPPWASERAHHVSGVGETLLVLKEATKSKRAGWNKAQKQVLYWKLDLKKSGVSGRIPERKRRFDEKSPV